MLKRIEVDRFFRATVGSTITLRITVDAEPMRISRAAPRAFESPL